MTINHEVIMKFHKIMAVLCLLFLSSTYLYSQNQITEYEFWTNSDYSNKVSVSITPSEVLTIDENIELQGLKPGFNNVSIRFKDSDGNYSSVYSQFVWAYSSESPITEYEYWFDGDNSAVHNIEIESSETAEINAFLDATDLSNGFHSVHIRFRNSGGLWSVVYSKMFFTSKSPEFSGGDIDMNTMTHYRYWFDVATEPIVVALEPEETFQTNFSVDIPDLAESFYIQFRDISGLWSGVYHRPFIPIADFEIYRVVNTFTMQNKSTFSTKFYWDFDDGTKSEGVHPSHTYETPGVYDICLIAENKLGFDTLCKTVQVSGIREVVSNEAGNNGLATLNIYGGGLKDGALVWLDGPERIDGDSVQLARLDALMALFDLYEKPLGFYSINVQNPGEEVMTLDNAFEIVKGTNPEPYVDISGRNKILFGREQTFLLNFGNTGNTDALGVPVYFAISKADGLEIDFQNLIFTMKKTDIEDGWEFLKDDFDAFFEIDSLFGAPFDGYLYILYFPTIPANYSESIEFKVKTNETFSMAVWCLDPYYQIVPTGKIKSGESPLGWTVEEKIAYCIKMAIAKAFKDGLVDITTSLADNLPFVACINKVFSKWDSWFDYLTPKATAEPRPKSWKQKFVYVGSEVLDYASIFLQCASEFIPAKKAYQAVKLSIAVFALLNDIKGGYLAEKACREKYKKKSVKTHTANAVASLDPNEIVGPFGYKNEKYLNTQNFSYTIFFENKATATAPAQEVVVLDTLEAGKYDFDSFTFGPFSFGGDYYNPLPGLKEFTLDIPLENGNTNVVRVNANFDTDTRVAYWQFITLDPESMALTEDPDGGFLPPNNTSPEGEGSVSYNIQLLDGLSNNEEINAKAMIFFDLNEPIETNEYLNTLDLEPPTSTMTGVFTTWEENLYRIEWEGSDEQSGVRYYTIYIAVDDEEYDPWFTTESTSLYFTADPDSVYKFFCIAADSAGNEEPMKTSYEASTEILSIGDIALSGLNDIVDVYPNPATNTINIEYTTFNSGKILISLVNSYGEEVFTQNLSVFSATNKHTIDSSDLPTGIYFLNLKGGNRTITKKVAVVK